MTFEKEINELNKGCGKLFGGKQDSDWCCGDFLEEDEQFGFGNYYYCPECQAKKEQTIKLSKAVEEVLNEYKIEEIYNNFIPDMDTYDDELRVQEMIVHTIKELKLKLKEVELK